MASGGDLEEQFSVLGSQFSVKSGGLPGATWKPYLLNTGETPVPHKQVPHVQVQHKQMPHKQMPYVQANATAPDGIFCFLS